MVGGFVATRHTEHRVALIEEGLLDPSEPLNAFFGDQDDSVFSVHHGSLCRTVRKALLQGSRRPPRLRRSSVTTTIRRGLIVEYDQQGIRKAPAHRADCPTRVDHW